MTRLTGIDHLAFITDDIVGTILIYSHLELDEKAGRWSCGQPNIK